MPEASELVTQLRRMVAEPDGANGYTDDVLAAALARHPLPDVLGRGPTHLLWTPGYDTAAAAAVIWGEKAAALAGRFDFTTDGSEFKRSQAYAQARQQEAYWRSRRVALPRVLAARINPPPAVVNDANSDLSDGN